MTSHDYLGIIIFIQLIFFAFAFGMLKANHPSQYKELGGGKAWLGFLSTMQFIAFFMALGFLRLSKSPTLTKKELAVYFGFFSSSWAMFIGVVYLLLCI